MAEPANDPSSVAAPEGANHPRPAANVRVDEEDFVRRLLKTYFSEPKAGPNPVIRARPVYNCTSAHDARGEAVILAVNHLSNKEFPLWAAYKCAYEFVDVYEQQLRTAKVDYDPEVYESIDATLWTRDVIRLLNEFMTEMHDEQRPIPKKPAAWDNFRFCQAAHKNRRQKMEDRHTILTSLCVVEPKLTENLEDSAFFAVYDGHGGDQCAHYAQAHLYRCLIELLNRPNPPEGEQLLQETIALCDDRFTKKCNKEKMKSGSTAVCVYVKDKVLTCGWLGDSSIGLMTADYIRTLSTNHTPEDPSEYKRIEDVGGMVVMIQGELRVNGVLNLTRSLGDLDGRPMISQTPGTATFALTGNEYLLFLACDGVWEALTESQVYDCVKKFVQRYPMNEFSHMGEFIAEEASDSGSNDNLTIMAICLKSVEELWALFN